MRHATNKPTAAQADLTAQATRDVLKLSFAGGRYAHAVWWLISTVAILAQGTSRLLRSRRPFTILGWLLAGCSCAGVRVVSTGVGDRPEDLQCAASFWHVRGRLLRAWVGACCGVRGLRVRLHFGRWATAREDLRVLPAFATRSACVSACCGRARALVAGVREFCCGRRAKQRSGRRRPAPAQTATVDAAKRLSKNCLHFSICACHPCAGAMLILSVSFQF